MTVCTTLRSWRDSFENENERGAESDRLSDWELIHSNKSLNVIKLVFWSDRLCDYFLSFANSGNRYRSSFSRSACICNSEWPIVFQKEQVLNGFSVNETFTFLATQCTQSITNHNTQAKTSILIIMGLSSYTAEQLWRASRRTGVHCFVQNFIIPGEWDTQKKQHLNMYLTGLHLSNISQSCHIHNLMC